MKGRWAGRLAILLVLGLVLAGCAANPGAPSSESPNATQPSGTATASTTSPGTTPASTSRTFSISSTAAAPASPPLLWRFQEGTSGAATPLVAWAPQPCDPSGVTSVRAPRGPVGWAEANATAAAVTAALGLHMVPAGGQWTAAGYWRANLTEGGWFTFRGQGLDEISWVLPEGFWPAEDAAAARAKVDAVLAVVGWPPSMRIEANMTKVAMARPVGAQSSMRTTAEQTVNGSRAAILLHAGYAVGPFSIPTTLRPDTGLYLRAGIEGAATEPLANPLDLGALASSFVYCAFGVDNEVLWPATLLRSQDRLVWELHLERHPGGLINVRMDAATGAILQGPPIPAPTD